ncbi:MAG: hypothetical protein ACK5NN_16050 [Sphingomonadaceae bacterium]
MSETAIIAVSALLGTAILAYTALHCWQGWLKLKEHELDHLPREIEGVTAMGSARIELADLKERIRKLEAIANGVEL